jgi:hypothetical protein
MAEEIFAYFIHFIFPMASDREIGLDLDYRIMVQQLFILERTVLQLEDSG